MKKLNKKNLENFTQRLSVQDIASIFENHPLPCAIFDFNGEEGKAVYHNTCFTETFGYDLNDIQTIDDWLLKAYPDPDYRKYILNFWASLDKKVGGKNEQSKLVLDVVTKSGSICHVNYKLIPLENNLYCGMFVNITERILAEKKIKEREKLYFQLFNEMNSGVAVYTPTEDGDFLIKDLNQGSETIGKVKKEEVIGKKVTEVFQGVEKMGLLDILREVAKTGVSKKLNNALYEDDKRKFWAQNLVYRLATGEVVAVFDDITEQKENELELKKRNEEIERINEELKRFAFAASHDLKEPLRTVNNYIELIKMKYEKEMDSDTERWFHYILDHTRQMNDLIKNILIFSTMDKKEQAFEPLSCQLVVDRIAEQLDVLIREKNVTLIYKDLPTINGFKMQIVQIFQNLLENAIKFNISNNPVVEIESYKSSDGKETIFVVRDNGMGIKKEYQEKIFLPFTRLHHQKDFKGSGIGLTIVRRAVENHGGKIWVESSPEKGSSFFLTLPA